MIYTYIDNQDKTKNISSEKLSIISKHSGIKVRNLFNWLKESNIYIEKNGKFIIIKTEMI